MNEKPGFQGLRYSQQEKLTNGITAHGKAWLALHDFVCIMVTQEELETMDNKFIGNGEFYPQEVLTLAKERLNKLWHEVNDLLAHEEGIKSTLNAKDGEV